MVPRVPEPPHVSQARGTFEHADTVLIPKPSPPLSSYEYSQEADDERSSSDTFSMEPILDSQGSPIVPRYPGEDTRWTSTKELLGFYMYGFAAEVFVVCGVGKSKLFVFACPMMWGKVQIMQDLILVVSRLLHTYYTRTAGQGARRPAVGWENTLHTSSEPARPINRSRAVSQPWLFSMCYIISWRGDQYGQLCHVHLLHLSAPSSSPCHHYVWCRGSWTLSQDSTPHIRIQWSDRDHVVSSDQQQGLPPGIAVGNRRQCVLRSQFRTAKLLSPTARPMAPKRATRCTY